MPRLFEKLFSKGKVINIKNKKHKQKSNVYNYYDEISVFEIQRAINMNEKQMLICGKVLQGIFKVNDKIKIRGHKKNILKLEGKIVKITTALVEANKVSRGIEADLLIAVEQERNDIIHTGNKIYKI